MVNFTDLLGSLVQTGMSGSSRSRATNALGGKAGAGSLSDLTEGLGKMLGGSQSSSARPAGGLEDALGSVLGSLGNNKAALGGLGALAGALLGGGSNAARGAVGGGFVTMLASLAMSALKSAGQKPQVPRALMEAETSEQQEFLKQDAELIIKAMINAAKADGKIDRQEVQKIIGKLDDDGLTEDEKEFFTTEANRPIDLNGIVSSAQNRPELAAQIYAASLLAIEVDTNQEKEYMAELARGLGLPQQSVSYIEQTMGLR